MSRISGFSKISKNDKIDWLLQNYLQNDKKAKRILKQYWNTDKALQQLHDGFIENTISNFYLPYALSPNFLIDNKTYAVPMVIEESSVVAASSKAAKFWMTRGGFKTTILGNTKIGHIHFLYDGNTNTLKNFFEQHKSVILEKINPLQKNMKQRGGGILEMKLIDQTGKLENYYQIEIKFDTVDSMGANFINTILEEIAIIFKNLSKNHLPKEPDIIMSILSNYNLECVVRSEVSCKIADLATDQYSGAEYVKRFIKAIEIAEVEPYRAVTHNKGVMNGIDAVVIATGNDFRAVEANAHAFAAKNGKYTSLTHAETNGKFFKYWIEIPLSLGTIGGLTGIHPLVKFSLQLLQNPNARDLMKIVATAGLAQNFSALNSLITDGIQSGHMKMHLNNLLNFLGTTEDEKSFAQSYFKDKRVSFNKLKEILNK